MRPKEAANLIVNAYLKKCKQFLASDTKRKQGISNVRDVFFHLENKEYLKELLSFMFQPQDEELYVNKVEKKPWEQHGIQINLTHGMGLDITSDEQLDIYLMLDAKDFDFKQFGRMVSHLLQLELRKFKGKRCEKYLFV